MGGKVRDLARGWPENGPTGISQTEWRGTDLRSGEVSLPSAGSAGSADSAGSEAEAAEAAEALRSSCT